MSANHEHPNPNPHDDPDSGGVALVGFVGSLIFVFVVVAVAALCYRTDDTIVDKRVYGQPVVAVAQLHAAQEAALNSPAGEHVINEATGEKARHVPLDEAMKLALRDMTAPPPAPPPPPPPAQEGAATPGNGLEAHTTEGSNGLEAHTTSSGGLEARTTEPEGTGSAAEGEPAQTP